MLNNFDSVKQSGVNIPSEIINVNSYGPFPKLLPDVPGPFV